MPGELTRIGVYPLKSARGGWQDHAVVEPWGLRGDRRWGVLDGAGERLRAVEVPAIFGVTASLTEDGGLRLEADGSAPLVVAEPGPEADLRSEAFTRLDRVRSAGPEADAWLSAAVGTPASLVWLDDPRHRRIGEEHGGLPEEAVSLADTGPLLLASEASLRRLDEWVAEGELERGDPFPAGPLDMMRFRPNLVVDGFEPFAEDGWERVRVGDVVLRRTELCDRCAMTLYDPRTLVSGKEPIRTLSRHRRWDGLTWFGARQAPESTGAVRVGDPVEPVRG